MSQPHFFYFKKPLFFLVVHILPSKTKYKYVVHRRDLRPVYANHSVCSNLLHPSNCESSLQRSTKSNRILR